MSFSAPTRIGLPSVSKRFSASSVTQQPSALVASWIAPSISNNVPSRSTVTSSVTSVPERLRTFATPPPSHAATEGYSILLDATSCRGRTRKASWQTPADIKAHYRSASFVGNNRVVFNIKGNDYRLIVAIAYRVGIVYIKFIGTHAQYDAVDAATVDMN